MKIKLLAMVAFFLLINSGCSIEPASTASPAGSDLADEILIIDTHMDSPMLVHEAAGGFTLAESTGHFNYQKAREGGLNAAFMAVYISPSMKEKGGAAELADRMIDEIHDSIRLNPEKFAAALTPDDIEENFRKGLISLPIGIENGTALEEDLQKIVHYYDRGVRYMTLTHSRANAICDSSFDEDKVWGGVSPFGKKVVEEMNRLGMMIDVSHASDDAFYQVLEISKAPVLATHSCCRHFVPGLERNMSDEMIRKMAQSGGLIQINFCASFLDSDYADASREISRKLRSFMEEKGLTWRDPEAVEYRKKLQAENPLPEVPLSRVVDHIEHVVDLAGIDHVGLGSDFDGIGDAVPTGLEDVSKYRDLVREMQDRGFTREEIEQVCGGNLLRLWKEVENRSEKEA